MLRLVLRSHSQPWAVSRTGLLNEDLDGWGRPCCREARSTSKACSRWLEAGAIPGILR